MLNKLFCLFHSALSNSCQMEPLFWGPFLIVFTPILFVFLSGSSYPTWKKCDIKPLRTSSVASCHLPPIQFLEWKMMPFSSHFERRYFWLCEEGCQKPSENLKFPQSPTIWHLCPMPSLYPSTPRSLLLFKARVLIIAHFTSLPPSPSHSTLFFIAIRGGWFRNEIHHSTVLTSMPLLQPSCGFSQCSG